MAVEQPPGRVGYLRRQGEKPFPIGTVQKGGSGVVYDSGVTEEESS